MGLGPALDRSIRDHVNPMGQPAAVVASGHITGLAVVRSLGARGVPTIVLDREETGVAFASRHTTARGLVANPQTETAAFVERLVEIGEVLDQPGVLFPTNDDWLLAILRHADRLRPYYRIPFPDHDTVERILDKTRLYDEVRRLGIDLPDSHELDDESFAAVRDTIQYPAIVKPAHQRPFYDAFGVKVFRVDNPAELDRVWQRTRPHSVLVQQIVPAEAATFVSLGSLVAPNGDLRAAVVGAKRHQYPGDFGTACLVDTVDAPEVIEQGHKLLRAVEFHGVSELEYIHDARDDTYKVIDLNTRVWKWIGLPIAAGVDLPWLTYQQALEDGQGNDQAPVLPSRHVRWVHAQDYLRLRSSGGGAAHALSDADWSTLFAAPDGTPRRVVDAVVDAHDPDPAARQIQNLFCDDPYYCPC